MVTRHGEAVEGDDGLARRARAARRAKAAEAFVTIIVGERDR